MLHALASFRRNQVLAARRGGGELEGAQTAGGQARLGQVLLHRLVDVYAFDVPQQRLHARERLRVR